MKRKNLVITLLMFVSIVCLIVASCKPDNITKPDSIVGSWKMTGYIHYGVDVYGTAVPPCIIDDIITFSSTNVISNDEGLTKCDPKDPQTLAGTYSVSSDQKQLTIDFDGSTDTDNILILTSTTLKLEQLSNGDLITFTRLP